MYRRWETDSDDESQVSDVVLSNIKAKLSPANDIISKDKKADDEAPRLKLLTPKPTVLFEQRITDPPKAPLQISKFMKSAMNSWDSLLKYFEEREKDLLYLKLDNRQKMRLQTDGKIVNYFSGYFEDITNKAFEKQNKIFEASQSSQKKKRKSSFVNKLPYYSANYHVIFDSCFESGNLFAAFRLPNKSNQFQLIMQNDVNSRGNTQWFNFRCKLPKGTFIFNIINYTKNDSLYNYGMKVSVYSNNNRTWTKSCQNISYQSSNIFRQNSTKQYYTLSFSYTNEFENDMVTFANSYTSTYSQILSKCQKRVNKKVSKILICKTYLGLEVFALKIGDSKHQNSTNSFNSSSGDSGIKKKSLVFMARQHPGQTPGSLVMDGILQSLLTYGEFQIIKKQFIVYLIPVLNPDGVVYGNYRTNLCGCDLNRKWRYPNETLHPQIYYTRRFLSNINRQNPILLILDSHGHSKKFNSFFYGNPSNDPLNNDNKLFPYICSLKSPKISFADSTFSVSQDKRNTARVVLNQMFPSAGVYTFQSSFSGYQINGIHHEYTVNQYKSVGKSILQGFVEFYNMKKSNVQVIMKQVIVNKQLKENKDDSGSDSQPQEDIINQIRVMKSLNDSIIVQPLQKAKHSISQKNSRPFKRVPLKTETKTKDQSTQTEKKYFINEILCKPKSIQQSSSVLKIFQLKSGSPQIKSRLSQDKSNTRNMIIKLAGKKAKIFGSSFTVKLWNKANSHVSSEDGFDNELQFDKIFSRGKK